MTSYNTEIFDESMQRQDEPAPYYTNIPTEGGEGQIWEEFVDAGAVPQKPPDEEFEIFNRWNQFKDYYIGKKFGGIDPGILNPEQDAIAERDKFVQGMIDKHGGQIYDQNLYNMIMKRADDVQKNTFATRMRAKENMTSELNEARSWFEKDAREKLKAETRLQELIIKQSRPPKELKKTDKDKEYESYVQSIKDQIGAGQIEPESKPMTRDAYFRWREEDYLQKKAKYKAKKPEADDSIASILEGAGLDEGMEPKSHPGQEVMNLDQLTGEPDASGYILGEIRPDREGNARQYIGDGQWQLVQ